MLLKNILAMKVRNINNEYSWNLNFKTLRL